MTPIRQGDTNFVGTANFTAALVTLPTNAATEIPFKATGTGTVSTTLDAILRTNALNAKTDFGAVGDNSHDDTTALQSWATAGAAQLRPLYLPAGTYKITSAINIGFEGMHVYGDGMNVSTIMQHTTTENGLTVVYAQDGLFNLHDFGVADSSAMGTTSTLSTGTAIFLDGHTGPNYTQCRISSIAINGFAVGIDFNDVDITTVTNVFTTNGDTAFYVHGNSNNITFTACNPYLMNTSRYGYHFDGSSGGNTCSVNGTDVLGQTSGSSGVLIQIDQMFGAAIRNVSVENNPNSGFPVEITGSSQVTIENLILRTNANSYAVHVTSSSAHVTINGMAGTNSVVKVDQPSYTVYNLGAIDVSADIYSSGSLLYSAKLPAPVSWPGNTAAYKNDNSYWSFGGNGGKGFWRFPSGIAVNASVALDFNPTFPSGGIAGMGSTFRISSLFSGYSAFYTVAANNVDGFGGAGIVSGVQLTPGHPFITASGSITVSDGDIITDGAGASAKAVAGSGTSIFLRWLNGTKWFTTGAPISVNSVLSGKLVASPGTFTSALSNVWFIWIGHDSGSIDGICIQNTAGQTLFPTISLEY